MVLLEKPLLKSLLLYRWLGALPAGVAVAWRLLVALVFQILLVVTNFLCFYFHQALAMLLLLLAITELIFTIVQDLGQQSASASRNPAVQYTNPALYVITWVRTLAA